MAQPSSAFGVCGHSEQLWGTDATPLVEIGAQPLHRKLLTPHNYLAMKTGVGHGCVDLSGNLRASRNMKS